MAIHLTPTELAREAGMHRREVITKCMQMGVPIFEGRIDKTLFMATLRDDERTANPSLAKASTAPLLTPEGLTLEVTAIPAVEASTGSKTLTDLALLAARKPARLAVRPVRASRPLDQLGPRPSPI